VTQSRVNNLAAMGGGGGGPISSLSPGWLRGMHPRSINSSHIILGKSQVMTAKKSHYYEEIQTIMKKVYNERTQIMLNNYRL
jgi:hypothetical protein